jgi:hypothetical protein
MERHALRLVIRSVGQSGVDRAALDAARRWGLPSVGWCPCGGWAEDYPEPPGLVAVYPCLRETPSTEPAQRTAWNVRDSHATLVLLDGTAADNSTGTELTIKLAQAANSYLWIANVVNVSETADVLAWLVGIASSRGDEGLVLNVAGPRESERPGIYQAASQFLDLLVASVFQPPSDS